MLSRCMGNEGIHSIFELDEERLRGMRSFVSNKFICNLIKNNETLRIWVKPHECRCGLTV